MAKKRLDVADITNELQHSAFFPAAQPAIASRTQEASAAIPDEHSERERASATSSPLSHATTPPELELPRHAEPGDDTRAHLTKAAPLETTLKDDRTRASNHASSAARMDASMLARELAPQAAPVSEPAPVVTPQPPLPRNLPPDLPPEPRPTSPAHARDVIEAIRKCVRQIGKVVTYVRLTANEKRQLTEIVYTYTSQGLKTSENEISRIGINWMLEDYHLHGSESVLARVLAALNA